MTQHDPYVYQRLSSTNDPSFNDFYRIYADSIRPSEAKTEAQIAAMLSRFDYFVLLMKKSGIVVGFTVLYVPKEQGFCLLEYMAVHREYRNAGIGTSLLRTAVRTVQAEHGDIPILLEVDSECESSSDHISRKVRKQFYRKNGCLQVKNLSYHLPLDNNGTQPEMDLMMYTSPTTISIPKKELERWLRLIYESVYSRSPRDRRIDQMLIDVTDPIELI